MTVATRKILLSGLLGIASAGVIAATGYAAQPPQWVQKMSRTELHEALGKAIEADDYNAFTSAIKGKPGAQAITQQQFDALVAAHTLHEAGKDSQAQILLQHAGIAAPTTTK
jgi:lysine/ornithine N-monooxygenase